MKAQKIGTKNIKNDWHRKQKNEHKNKKLTCETQKNQHEKHGKNLHKNYEKRLLKLTLEN